MLSLDQEQLYLFATEILLFIVIILLTAFIAKISKTIIEKTMPSSSPYLAARIKRYTVVLIWAIGILLLIRQAGISIDILILLIALTGIGFITSAYPVLQNIISRSFMNLQFQYRAGDIISIGAFSGKVIEITDLNTVLLNEEGNLVSIPNVLFLKEIWVKHQLSGYEITVPFVIKKDIDVVTFEKELVESITKLKKYFKKEPKIVTSKTDEKTIELSLILNLKDPEKKSVVITDINEIILKLIEEFTRKTEEMKKEAKLKEIKDIGK